MSKEDLSDLIHAAEHNALLRNEIRKCKSINKLRETAKKYGFILTVNDFKEDEIEESISQWFIKSRIPSIRIGRD